MRNNPEFFPLIKYNNFLKREKEGGEGTMVYSCENRN